MDAVREIVERLLRDANALAVRLSGPNVELGVGDPGAVGSRHDSPVKDATLSVVYDLRTSLGLVRLRPLPLRG